MNQPLISLNDYASGKVRFVNGVQEPRVSPVVAKAQIVLSGRTSQPVRGNLNALEGRYAKHLEWRKRSGEVVAYWYEAIKFRLADGSWFCPDFFVVLASGQCEVHEVKGHMREAANVRLKVTSELFWCFPVRLVKEKKGAWTLTEVGR